MRRILGFVVATCLLVCLSGIASAGDAEAGKPVIVRLSLGRGGEPAILSEAAFAAWTPESAPPVAERWPDLVKKLAAACGAAPLAAPEPAPENTAKLPIRLLLRWNPTILRCKVYVGQVLCNYGDEGMLRASAKIESIVQEGNAANLLVDAGSDLPCSWVVAAGRMAKGRILDKRRIPGNVLIAVSDSFPFDAEFTAALESVPSVEPKEGRLPGVVLHCVLHPDAPFGALDRILAASARFGVRTFLLGSAPETLYTFSLSSGAPGGSKMDVLTAMGGGRHTESAVMMGLVWLKNHQSEDGRWSCSKFNGACKKGMCTGAGASDAHDAGITGLALLAFLGAGHTHKQGAFKETVKEGLKALHDLQGPEGRFGPESPDGVWMYDHAICTQAAVEAYGLSGRSALLEPMAAKAVEYLLSCRNPGKGWRYGRKPGDSDTSCTAWAVSALAAAKLAGLAVPDEAVSGALAWFDSVTDKTVWRTGYISPGDSGARTAEMVDRFVPNEAMTAAAMFSRILLLREKAADLPSLDGGAALLLASPPRWDVKAGAIDYYYWYWGTLAAFQMGNLVWKQWNTAMKNALVPTQKREGCENGSWDPVDPWGATGGRVYATALNTLTLEVYYRFGKLMEKK
jgi:hypothetical protein